MKKNNIFTHKFLPILGLVFFILFILLINNSFANSTYNVDTTNIPENTLNYLNDCFLNVENYYKENSLEYKYYALFTDSDTGSFTDFNQFLIDGSHFYIILFNDDVTFASHANGCWTKVDSYTTAALFTFWTSKTYIGVVNTNFHPDTSFSGVKVFYTNYSNEYIDTNEFKNLGLFYLSNTEPTYDYPQILSQLFDYENINNYEAYISLDDEKWESFNVEYFNINDDGSPQENSPFTYYYNVFENGNYHIRLFDNSTGQYIYDDYINVTNLAFDIYYSTEETDEPLYVYSNDFPFDSYFVYISKDRQNWEPMNLEYVDYVPGQDNILNAKERRWYYITSNGIYYFKFVECSAEEGVGDTYYVKKEINNLLVDNYMSDYYVPTPIISLDFNEEEQCFIVKTQNILLDKALNMKCFYTTDFESTNITNWTQMEIDFYNNTFLENSQEAYFYFTIPVVGASDTDYRIAFYNYFSNTAGEIVIYEFRYDKAIDYVENELKINLSFPIKFNILINYFKDRFGFLTYPIEFIINLLNKILNIEYGEPIINIPELYIPGTNTKVFSGYSYNFNILLENQAILNIYNIYLVAVDFIIIISLIVLAYKIIMEVFNK